MGGDQSELIRADTIQRRCCSQHTTQMLRASPLICSVLLCEGRGRSRTTLPLPKKSSGHFSQWTRDHWILPGTATIGYHLCVSGTWLFMHYAIRSSNNPRNWILTLYLIKLNPLPSSHGQRVVGLESHSSYLTLEPEPSNSVGGQWGEA